MSVTIRGVRLVTVVATAAALAVATACSTSDTTSAGGGSTSGSSTSSSPAAAPQIQGSIEFNDDSLAKLRDDLKAALKGKDLSKASVSVIVNNTAAYWNAAMIGRNNARDELKVKASFKEPQNGDISQQLSIIRALGAQGVTGFSVSAIQPQALKAPVTDAAEHGLDVIAFDSPLPELKDQAPIYLGTPNYQAGQKAGEAMKQLLGDEGGDVVILVGSLTAANATQRIQGFKDTIEGTNITVFQTYNDNLDPNKALNNAVTSFQADPDIKGIYGVYSYDGPSAGQAVKTAGKVGQVHIVADDAEPKTLDFLAEGVIDATVLQQPYQQGYMSVYLLTAMAVLGQDKTLDIVKPYMEDDGYTLSSGVGLVTKANLDAYNEKLASFGLTSS